ncbi:sensor histidine kinase [Tessaracoccus aquimaris]|nr:sensor histidine kinase [Tessaracoccus aquimaris]
MSLVTMPLSQADLAPVGPGRYVRAMEVGQHVIALVLTSVGVIRAAVSGADVPAAVIAGVVFLAWHTAGSVVSARSGSTTVAAWWLLGLVAVWIGATIVSAEFVWLAFLLWLLAGHLLSLGWGLALSVFVFAVVVAAPLLHHGGTSYGIVFGPLVGGVFAYGISRGYLQLLRDAAERERLVISLRSAHAEMADLQDELAAAQRQSGIVAERTRISRDIHDTVAQSLSSIRLLAHAQVDGSPDPAAARTLGQIEALAGDGLGDVRRIVAALAPMELEDNALAGALQRMVDRLRDETGVDATLRLDDTLPILSTEVEVALLRTAQSALANVRRHADAGRVVVSLIDAGDTVRLDIIDDGSGFDLPAWENAREAPPSSFGLRYMRDRLRELGGGLDIETAPGEGTAISGHLSIGRGRP